MKNFNDFILVKLTEKGILHYLSKINEGIPIEEQYSYREIVKELKDGNILEITLWSFAKIFGEKGICLADYVEAEFKFKK